VRGKRGEGKGRQASRAPEEHGVIKYPVVSTVTKQTAFLEFWGVLRRAVGQAVAL
jgi:hypothetical protein